MLGPKTRASLRAGMFLTLTGVLVLPFVALRPIAPRLALLLRRLWALGTVAILGIRVRRQGRPFDGCATVYVSNHSSYLDIPILAGMLDATFIAKSEVAGWPFFGFLAKVTATMFVRRHWRQALNQRNELARRLRAGEDFVLFGEGTSTNGLAIKPFKTSLLSVAEPWILDRPVAVQNITIVYSRLVDGTPINAENCDMYAWWGSRELMPHLWKVLQMQGVVVEVRIAEPVLSWSVDSRKILGSELREASLAIMREIRAACSSPEISCPDAALNASARAA